MLQVAATIKSCEDNHLEPIITADNRQNVTWDSAKSLSGRRMRRTPSGPQKKITGFVLPGATKYKDFEHNQALDRYRMVAIPHSLLCLN